jgi:hypothetical protein
VDREQQSTRPGATRATPPKQRTKAPAKAAKPKQALSSGKAGDSGAETSAPDIMSRLPRSRPQRASQRRRSSAVPAASKTSAARPAASAPKPPARQKRAPATARRPAPAPAPTSGGSGGGAPGLPRLAIDGATEAVKLPLKVSGRLTLKALDAVARGLRRR